MAAKKQKDPITSDITGYIIGRRRGEIGINELVVAIGQESGVDGLELTEENAGERVFIPEDAIDLVMDRMTALKERLKERAKAES